MKITVIGCGWLGLPLSEIIPYVRLNSYSYDTNHLGTFFKGLLVGIFSYLLIRFVKF